MTAGAAANILTIQDMIVRKLSEKCRPRVPLRSNTLLQGRDLEGLNWTDSELLAFLDGTIYPMFQIRVQPRQLRNTINGSSLTVGDLVIAVFVAINKLQRPRIRPARASVSRVILDNKAVG